MDNKKEFSVPAKMLHTVRLTSKQGPVLPLQDDESLRKLAICSTWRQNNLLHSPRSKCPVLPTSAPTTPVTGNSSSFHGVVQQVDTCPYYHHNENGSKNE